MASNLGITRDGLEISRSEFVLESTTDSVLVLDRRWRILYRNRQALDLLQDRDLSLGRSLWDAFPEALGGPFHEHYAWALEHQESVSFEEYLHSMKIWFEVHAYPSGDAITLFFRDVTERRRSREQLSYLATHDPLSGLHNRSYFQERLELMLSQERGPRQVALLYIDLDHFKEVNDSYGHQFGDALLKQVSQRLRALALEEDALARLGGDEFVLATSHAAEADLIGTLAGKLIGAISAPFEIDGCQFEIGASIGIAVAPTDGRAVDDLLRKADIALYAAKRGRRAYRFFEGRMADRLLLRQELKTDLARALERDELGLVYQPIYNVQNGNLVRYEALLLWHHPRRGHVTPAEFIPIAEETGLIVKIGEWALRTACAEASTWSADIGLAVNLSPAQFQLNLPYRVAEILNVTGLRTDRLLLEITETVLLGSTTENLRLLRQLQALGIKIALDDFGTGYSSLSYLRQFPFHEIKIDRSFVADESSEACAIVESVVRLGHALGMRVTAEGVETPEQLERIRRAGCDKAQGYLLGRPASFAHLPEQTQLRS